MQNGVPVKLDKHKKYRYTLWESSKKYLSTYFARKKIKAAYLITWYDTSIVEHHESTSCNKLYIT